MESSSLILRSAVDAQQSVGVGTGWLFFLSESKENHISTRCRTVMEPCRVLSGLYYSREDAGGRVPRMRDGRLQMATRYWLGRSRSNPLT